jgi:hypothetical protein
MPRQRRSRWRALAAALLCPLAFLLSVGGVTESVRVETQQPGGSVLTSSPVQWQSQPNSRESASKGQDSDITVVAQSVLLVLHLAAATTLVLRFLSLGLRRWTTATIAILSVSTALSAVAHILFARSTRWTNLSSAYWFAVAASAIACIVLGLLVWEVVRTRDYHLPRQRVTVKQRSLIITFFVFVLYLTIFSIMFKFSLGLL